MKKKIVTLSFMFLIGILSFLSFNIKTVYAQENQVRVIMNSAYVLSSPCYPDDFSTLAENVDYVKVYLTNKFERVDEIEYEDIRVESGLKYYKIFVEGFGDGYILTNHVALWNMNPLDVALDSNAEIKNDSVKVFRNSDGTDEIVGVFLNKGDKIKLLDGYDKSKDFLRCTVNFEGSLITGYIQKLNISVKGTSLELILAVIIILGCAVAGGVILIYFIKKKKKEQKRLFLAEEE